MKLSIIIVNYNTGDLLKNCIDSIIANSPKFACEIIVIDNASFDGSREVISSYPDIKKVFNRDNLGFAYANNIGIKIARGEYVLLLNSDTMVLPGVIDKMVEYMDKNSDVGILGPKLIGENGELIQMSWVFQPTIFLECIRKILSPQNIKKYSLIRHIVEFLQKETRKVQVITGASMLVRKKVFEQVGLLDEAFFLYFEEPDFCKRARNAGWKIIFYAEAKIVHLLGQSMSKIKKESQIQHRRSQIYYYQKHLSKFQQNLLNFYFSIKETTDFQK